MYNFDDLLSIMRTLRGENGCVWDKAQTHESIRINAVEEAYELVDAIDKGDSALIKEECGDVLLQAVFHAMIAQDAGSFTVADMIDALCEKIVSRHEHIFGSEVANDAETAIKVWENAKQKEKPQEKTVKDKMLGVPLNFPALLRAQKVLKKSGKLISSEKAAVGDMMDIPQSQKDKYIGDKLMEAVKLAIKYDVDAEVALKGAVDGFISSYEESK